MPQLLLTSQAITNHAETASKLSKSISQIADLLPQHSLHLIMYPTPQMQTCVARLYSHIMNFFLSSLKWYEDSRATHAIKSIFQPWDLKFRPEYEAIAAEALQIRRLADVAMKAELRDTRLEVQQGTRHWELVQQEMSELRMENQRLNSYLQATFKSLENSMLCKSTVGNKCIKLTNFCLAMYQELRIDFTAQRSTLSRVHLNQMLSLPLWNSLPTSGESLEFCRSMRNRNREYTRLPLPDVTKLETWASQRSNDVLLIGTYMPVIAKTFMVDLIDLVLDSGMPIVWALRYADYWDQKISPVDVIRGLVLQTMQIGADRLLEGSFPVTVEQLHEAGSLRDWVAILKRLLLSIGHAFVVLDADLLSHATSHERSLSLEMLETLRTILSGNVKIVISRSSVSRAYAEELEHANACVMIQTDRAKDLRKVRRTRRQRGRFRRW